MVRRFRAVSIAFATLMVAASTSEAAAAPAVVVEPPDVQVHVAGAFGKGRLGVQVQSMTEELRDFFGAPKTTGMLVANVEPDSVAAKAGLAVGDVLVEVDGDSISDLGDVWKALADRKTGDTVKVVVVRKKKRVIKTATMESDPSMDPSSLGSFTWPHGAEMPEIPEHLLRRLERLPEFERPDVERLQRDSERDLARELERTRRKLEALDRRLEELEKRSAPGRGRKKKK